MSSAGLNDRRAKFRAQMRSLRNNPYFYYTAVTAIAAGAIVLMVVPPQEIDPAPASPNPLLNVTFAGGDGNYKLGGKGYLSLVLVLFAFIVMCLDLVGADLVMNFTLTLMVLFNIISVKNAVLGFANTGLLTVVVLFIVAQGITATGGADYVVAKLLGSPNDTMLAQVRMCLITALFSTFVNDTPVFCIMLPIVLTWAAKARLPIRQLIIPLSYCCLLGGMNTTIGTSTNLVVTGQWTTRVLDPKSNYYQPGLQPISLFGVAPYGIPTTIFGIIYIILAAPFLLTGGAGKKVFKKYSTLSKRNMSVDDVAFEQGADFYIGLLVSKDSPNVGKTIEDAGLRHLDGIYLNSIGRGGKTHHAVSPDYTLAAGDILYFSGVPDNLPKIAAEHGLVPYTDAIETLAAEEVPGISATFGVSSIQVPKDSSGSGAPLELVQATIAKTSDLNNVTIKAAAFRSRFHAAVVSIKRNSIPLEWSGPTIGDEVLKVGDEVLLDVAPQFWTSPDVNTSFNDIRKGGTIKSHSEFMLPMRVTRLLNNTRVESAGLRRLPNAFLVAIERNGTVIHAVSPEELLQTDDTLWFATGDVNGVRFIRNTPGLTPLSENQAKKLRVQHVDRRLVQAIVSPYSPLVGQTLKDVRFREAFNGAVIAVARHGERIHANPGSIPLKGGDSLLVDAGPSFVAQHKDNDKYFSLVIEFANSNPPRYFHTFICVALVATAFILYGLNKLDILTGAATVAAALLLTGCLSGDQARNAIRWDVYLMIAGSFGVSAGLEQSGGAAAIANLIIDIGKSAGGDAFIVGAIYIATTLVSQVISNNSAAAIIFPIAATISKNDGVDIYILSYAVMLGASSVFMSSFGYQTNLMALAAGGHSSRDFLKFGSPMQIVLAVVSIGTLIAGLNNQLNITWIVTAIAGTVVLSAPQVVEIAQWLKNRNKAAPFAAEPSSFKGEALVNGKTSGNATP